MPTAALAAEIAELAEPGDERAIRVLEAAAREVTPLALTSGVAHLRRAMELALPATPRRMRLAARLVPLLWETGEPEEARTLAREVVRTPPDAVTHAQMPGTGPDGQPVPGAPGRGASAPCPAPP
ncbi:hypothetical protein [Streptomyces sp. KR55]|uniref:hypothetical protein n=1 Tax=Streptomyces sp. KR55 TaxID=3457425 RepID=UPI003FD67D5E